MGGSKAQRGYIGAHLLIVFFAIGVVAVQVWPVQPLHSLPLQYLVPQEGLESVFQPHAQLRGWGAAKGDELLL